MPKSFKPRLRRLDWLFTDCPVYFLTVCTLNRRPILAHRAKPTQLLNAAGLKADG